MTKSYSAILIDPAKQTVERITVADPLVTNIRGLIGCSSMDSFRIADHPESFDQGWVNDTGLSAGAPVHAFRFDNRRDPLAGNCVIIGCDRAGEATDALMTTAFVSQHVEWLGLILPKVRVITDGNVRSYHVEWEPA